MSWLTRRMQRGLGGQGASLPLRFASASNQFPNTALAFNLGTGAAQTDLLVNQQHIFGQDIPTLVLSAAMQWLKASVGVSNVGNAINVIAMSVVYNGAVVAVTSGGLTSFTIADIANWQADPLASTAFGGATKFSKGTACKIKVQFRSSAPTTDKYPIGRSGLSGVEQIIYLDPAKTNITTGVMSTGQFAYSMTNGGVNGTDAKFGNNVVPIFALGYHTKPAPVFFGDSKTYGTGDTMPAVGVIGMSRTLFTDPASAASVQCSGMNFGCPSGYALETYTATAAGSVANFEYWYTLGTHAIVGYGTNNLSSANQTTMYGRIRANGITQIIQRSLTPRTTSTDSWATTANQTINASWGIGSSADTFESFLRGNVATDVNFTYYQSTGERASATLGTTDYWKFAVNGTANYATGDGLHEGGTAPGYELNVGTGGTVTTQAGGTVAMTLRALVGTFV